MSLPLSCTVRGCGEPLTRIDRTYRCARGHTFDIARSGYVSLLQPQDRKSLDAGDTRDAVRARRDLFAAGIGVTLADALITRITALASSDAPLSVVELGCGAGDALARLAERRPIHGIGIDLSTAAADDAARRFPELTWLVANADRRLPLLDLTIDVMLSVHARRNPLECHRVLRPDGHLLVAIPAAQDLIELRELVQGEGIARDRVPTLIAEHDAWFTVVDHTSSVERRDLDGTALRNLLRGTYRGERWSQLPQVQQLDRLRVTLASDIVLFAPRRLH